MTNILILYYSTYGTNAAMAEIAAKSLEDKANVRLRKIPETAPMDIINSQEAWKANYDKQASTPDVTSEDLVWANGIIFSLPTRFGNIPSQAQAFFDTLGGVWYEGKLANKAITAMTSAGNTHGGQEATLLSLYKSMMHWGGIIVPPGYVDPILFEAGGNPYGISQTGSDISDITKKAIAVQANRLKTFAEKIA